MNRDIKYGGPRQDPRPSVSVEHLQEQALKALDSFNASRWSPIQLCAL
jgi:hypothetical protein